MRLRVLPTNKYAHFTLQLDQGIISSNFFHNKIQEIRKTENEILHTLKVVLSLGLLRLPIIVH